MAALGLAVGGQQLGTALASTMEATRARDRAAAEAEAAKAAADREAAAAAMTPPNLLVVGGGPTPAPGPVTDQAALDAHLQTLDLDPDTLRAVRAARAAHALRGSASAGVRRFGALRPDKKNERLHQEAAEPQGEKARTKKEQAELAALDQELAEARKDYWDYQHKWTLMNIRREHAWKMVYIAKIARLERLLRDAGGEW